MIVEHLSINSVDTTIHKNAILINEAQENQTSDESLPNVIFISKGTNMHPEIGDVKVSFSLIKPDKDYSVISKQIGNSFEAFKTKTGTSIHLISKGINSSEQMFGSSQKSNTAMTWALRLIGFLMMFGGLY